MSDNEPLPLETYAETLAHLLRRRDEPTDAVLASLGVTAETFARAEQFWTDALAQSYARRKGVLAMKFASALALAQRKVGLLSAREESISAPTTEVMPGVLRPEVLPSDYLRDGLFAKPYAPEPQNPPMPLPAAVAAAPPMEPRAAAGQPKPLPLPPAPARPTFGNAGRLAVTMPLAGNVPQGPSLPFLPGAAAQPIAEEPPRAAAPPALRTGTVLPTEDKPAQPVTPWEDHGPELPATTTRAPAMSIERYAELVTELTLKPKEAAAILGRYGVRSVEEYQQLEATFEARFRDNKTLQANYDALVMNAMARMTVGGSAR